MLFPRTSRGLILVAAAGAAAGSIACNSVQIESLPLTAWLLFGAATGALALTGARWVTARALAASAGGLEKAMSATLWPFAAFALLPIQFLPFSLVQAAGEEGVLRPLAPAWQTAIVLILSACLVMALLCLKLPVLQKGPLAAIGRRPIVALVIIMVLWLAAASAMDILKTYYMNKIGGSNTAIFTDAFQHAFSDKGLFFTTLALSDGSSILGIHSTYLFFIVYPLFRLWPGYQSLLIISNAALVATAIPIYLLGRKFFSSGMSLLIVLVFLFNRLIIAQPGIGDLSEQRFLPVMFVTAFYFWYTRRFLLYMAFAFLCLTVREDMGIVLMIWGLLGLFQRRSLKWILGPALLGGAWLLVMAKLVMPHFNPTGQPVSRAVYKYKNLGDSTGEIFKNLIKPWVLFRIPFSTIRHVAVWFVIFQSYGYGAPLLAAPCLLAIVPIMENTFLAKPGLNLFNMIPVAATLMPAMIMGLVAADRFSTTVWRVKVATSIVILSLFSTLALSYTWFNPDLFKPRYNYDTATEILKSMPAGSTAILPDFMSVLADQSQTVYGYHNASYEFDMKGYLDIEEDYVVFDTELAERFSDTTTYDGWTKIRHALATSTDYRLVLDKDDLQVFQKTPVAT